MQLTPEDAKLVTLARASRARTGAAEGAAVRDRDGRTYAAATVALPSLEMTALDLAVAMAVSSGATGLEAGAVVGEAADPSVGAVRDVAGPGVDVVVADAAGTPQRTVTT
ncbi:cytidine deaminase [Aeromicrobium halocynthiae]|uniref:Cytidine deaminase n=1 Tax=Aeromicrobium halocynthiae TaxID=560557 RepID=A0ABN2VXH3_9ACTN